MLSKYCCHYFVFNVQVNMTDCANSERVLLSIFKNNIIFKKIGHAVVLSYTYTAVPSNVSFC